MSPRERNAETGLGMRHQCHKETKIVWSVRNALIRVVTLQGTSRGLSPVAVAPGHGSGSLADP